MSLTTERQPRLPYPEHQPGFGFVDLVSLIVERSFSPELLKKSDISFPDVAVTLGTCVIGQEVRTTRIGAVDSIGEGTVIEVGAHIGRNVSIGSNSVLGAGVILEHESTACNQVIMEEGSALRIGAVANDRAHLGENSELSYDAVLEAEQKLLPGEIRY
jgi:UDP-3-O-[3-hydroxymyristoyl] glucosamine N-acyltransferase